MIKKKWRLKNRDLIEKTSRALGQFMPLLGAARNGEERMSQWLSYANQLLRSPRETTEQALLSFEAANYW